MLYNDREPVSETRNLASNRHVFMTTITTFEDILTALEQNPQLRAALRNYVLDEELKQLPAIVRRNQELLEQFIQQQAEITAKLQAGMDQLNDTLNRFMESTNAILAAHAERMTRLESGMAELKSDVAEVKSDMAEVKSDVIDLKAVSTRLDTRLTRVESNVSNIKGQITPITARRMIGRIADVTQCRRPRWLEDHEIIDLSDDADTSGVPPNELESFRAIDLVMRGIDRTSPTGEQQYVVIECSATVASNDVARAKRNAAYMTQFTGLSSKAVVIGTEIPPSIANLAERESVYCVTLTDKAARPR